MLITTKVKNLPNLTPISEMVFWEKDRNFEIWNEELTAAGDNTAKANDDS